MKKTMQLVLGVLLFSGCASVGRKLDTAKVEQIKKGETTREQVLKLIGSPDQTTKSSNGDVTFSYMYSRATAKGSSFIPIVGAFAGGVNTQNQTAVVTFGPDGIVKEIVSSYGASDIGMGLESGSKANIKEVEQGKRPK